MCDNLPKWAKQIFCTKLGLLLVAGVWTMIFWGIYFNIESAGEIFFYTGLLGVAYLVIMLGIMLVYAWIINPIKQRKKNSKSK